MFDTRGVEAAILARFDGGLTWREIHELFGNVPKRHVRSFVGDAEDAGHLRWEQPPKVRGVLRGRGSWHLTEAGRAFIRASAEGTA